MPLENIKSVLEPIAQSEEVGIQINQAGNSLTIVLNRHTGKTEIDYPHIAEKMRDALQQTSLPDNTSIRFYGRKKGIQKTEWQANFKLRKDITSASQINPQNSALTKTKESSPQNLFDKFRSVQETVAAIALVGIFGVLLTNSVAGQKTKAVTWEYRIESIPDLTFTENMNNLGDDGWQLVFARRAQDSITDEFSYECIFKKEVQ